MSVHVENLTRYAPASHRKLLDDINLTFPTGAFVALVGPSGAGKTTLLRAIAGLDQCEEGVLTLNGNTLTTLQDRAGKIGFVFQNYALFPHMTVARNISFGLDVLPRGKRPSPTDIASRIEELLELMQIPALADAYPARLSGGQRQRVALARALATGPTLLLLDEPFGALDPIVRRTIRTWLRTLHDQLGLTTILVTHDQEEALEVADRIVVMQNGRVVQDASPSDLDEKPQTSFVMEFLGEAVTFKGQVKSGYFMPDEAHVGSFPTQISAGPAEAMIRPFEIILHEEGDAAVPLTTHGKSNGFRHYSAALSDRIVPVFVPETSGRPHAKTGCALLNIQNARIFRNGNLAN